MPTARVAGLDIAYERFGPLSAPVVLLLNGAGRQLTEWNPELIRGLTDGGRGVIAMDARDTGLSTHLHSAGKARLAPPPRATASRPGPPYTLDDLADDAAGLLAVLAVPAAHLIGFSLGGAVAQQLALRHPGRVLSLVSIAATAGAAEGSDTASRRRLMRAPPRDRRAAIDSIVAERERAATPHSFDAASERARVAAAMKRAFDPAGTGRQLAALWAAGDRTGGLGAIAAPTLIVHGSADPVVDVAQARAAAAAVPGARLLVIEGMGHDVPGVFLDRMLAAILDLFDDAEGPAPG